MFLTNMSSPSIPFSVTDDQVREILHILLKYRVDLTGGIAGGYGWITTAAHRVEELLHRDIRERQQEHHSEPSERKQESAQPEY